MTPTQHALTTCGLIVICLLIGAVQAWFIGDVIFQLWRNDKERGDE